jgi:hypothetical protein
LRRSFRRPKLSDDVSGVALGALQGSLDATTLDEPVESDAFEDLVDEFADCLREEPADQKNNDETPTLWADNNTERTMSPTSSVSLSAIWVPIFNSLC